MDQENVDLSLVDDPNVRRALRAMQQKLDGALARQQAEIEALLETLMEKHLSSVGEFKRILTRVQQHDPRSSRLHELLTSPAPAAAPANRPPIR